MCVCVCVCPSKHTDRKQSQLLSPVSSATVSMFSQLPDTVDVSVAAAAKPTAQPCVVDVVDTLTSATCDQGPIGSVVRIQLSGALEHILVCEVRVFGRPFTEGGCGSCWSLWILSVRQHVEVCLEDRSL